MLFAADAFEHVQDSSHWHFFESLHWEIHLPLGLTKYKILMVVAALLVVAIYVPLARRAQSGQPPRGGWWNAFESLLTFLREQVAKPCIGHDADRYVHYVWTVFLFILVCNLLGMFPFMGSPTASFSVTVALAVCTFFFIHGTAVYRMGFMHYVKSYIPHLDVPFGLGYFVVPLIFFLELIGNVIKAFVLAVRLFANMFAGHLVLAFILVFIFAVRNEGPALFWGVTLSSIIGVIALSLLELFVAFLQAYVFAFLTALFLGSALHPQH